MLSHGAALLEEGRLGGPRAPFGSIARGLAAGVGRVVRLVHRVELPPQVSGLGIGGGTFGGSYKTPLAIAVAAALADRGVATCLVGHGFGGALHGARVVSAADDPAVVGDEALVCARRVRTVVGATRAAAVACAVADGARVLVFDGTHQIAPSPFARSLLAVDARAPFGAGLPPPAGDARSTPARLMALADEVVRVHAGRHSSPPADTRLDGPVHDTTLALTSLRTLDGEPAGSVARLADAPFALVTAIGRPARLVAALAAQSLHPTESRRVGDHDGAALRRALAALAADRSTPPRWVVTEKCATWLTPAWRRTHPAIQSRVLVLGTELPLPPALLDALVAALPASRP